MLSSIYEFLLNYSESELCFKERNQRPKITPRHHNSSKLYANFSKEATNNNMSYKRELHYRKLGLINASRLMFAWQRGNLLTGVMILKSLLYLLNSKY